MSQQIVLFGAGAAGRYALKHLRSQGIEPLCFADNDRTKFGTFIDGLMVSSPAQAQDEWPDATWVTTAISRPSATEIRAEMKAMGVKTKPLWECIPVCHGLPPRRAIYSLYKLLEDTESRQELLNQRVFRESPDYDEQRDPSPISELYFPDFIKRLDAEVFCDCGAADGDTVKAFMNRWRTWKGIVAIEPDSLNFAKLSKYNNPHDRITGINAAVSDFDGATSFASFGDYSSHIDSTGLTSLCSVKKLDSIVFNNPPTYIKMDVEGHELNAIWGARKLLKEHSPVLAICAYHTSDHLWEIPLLIHSINPDYRLYFRRYGEGAFEIVWYAVPPERIMA